MHRARMWPRLRQGRPIDMKYAPAFTRLAGLGEPPQLGDAWQDHRQAVPGTLKEATQQANERLLQRPDLPRFRNILRCRDCR